MTLKNKILKALGREEVQWYREFGVLAPFCPYCGEPAYDTHRCAFCGRQCHNISDCCQNCIKQKRIMG